MRTYTSSIPPTPSHKPKRTLSSPRRPPSRETENTPPPKRPSSVTRRPLQRQNSVHSLPSSPPGKQVVKRSRSRGSLQTTPTAPDTGGSPSPAKSKAHSPTPRKSPEPNREAQVFATPVKTPTKTRISVSSRDDSPVSTTAAENNVPPSPQILQVAPKTPSKKRLERGNHVDDSDSDGDDPLEKTTNPGVAIAVEEAIKNMFNQVKAKKQLFHLNFDSNINDRLMRTQSTLTTSTQSSARKRRRKVGCQRIPRHPDQERTHTRFPRPS